MVNERKLSRNRRETKYNVETLCMLDSNGARQIEKEGKPMDDGVDWWMATSSRLLRPAAAQWWLDVSALSIGYTDYKQLPNKNKKIEEKKNVI